MSISAMVWAYERKCPTPQSKFLLVTMANFANFDDICTARIGLLSVLTQLEDVERQLGVLVRDGAILPAEHEDGYQLLMGR